MLLQRGNQTNSREKDPNAYPPIAFPNACAFSKQLTPNGNLGTHRRSSNQSFLVNTHHADLNANRTPSHCDIHT